MERKVISMFTRKPLDEPAPFRSPHDVGRLLGSIDPEYASEVLTMARELRKKKEEIDHLVQEWETLSESYEVAIDDIHMLLDIEDYDPDEFIFILDDAGYAWLVRPNDIEEFVQLCNQSPSE